MLLTQEFKIFCHAYFNKGAAWSDRMEFVNGWYLLIIVSDTLTIVGSAHKIGIQTKVCLCWLLSCRVCVCVSVCVCVCEMSPCITPVCSGSAVPD